MTSVSVRLCPVLPRAHQRTLEKVDEFKLGKLDASPETVRSLAAQNVQWGDLTESSPDADSLCLNNQAAVASFVCLPLAFPQITRGSAHQTCRGPCRTESSDHAGNRRQQCNRHGAWIARRQRA